MEKPKVSVILAVYKAEQYIEKCARSLFGQTLDHMEFIFVDDCSPDNSIEVMLRVLEEYPNRKEQVKVVRHNKNQGVGKTRQDGIDIATGEYIIHCDPDDWVEIDMYEIMYNQSKLNNADITGCDYYDEYKNKTEYHIQDFNLKENEFIPSILYKGGLEGSLCNRLVNTDFYKKIGILFPTDINILEDLYIVINMHLRSNKIAYINKPLYHYRHENCQSLTTKFTIERIKSSIKVINMIEKNIHKYPEYLEALKYSKTVVSIPLITENEVFNPHLFKQLEWIKYDSYKYLSTRSKLNVILVNNGFNKIAKIINIFVYYYKSIFKSH